MEAFLMHDNGAKLTEYIAFPVACFRIKVNSCFDQLNAFNVKLQHWDILFE